MTVYQPGQRIALVHTTSPYTDLQPGDTGTVRRHDQQLNTVYVDWDNGSRLSMCLDVGDSIQPLVPATTGSLDAASRAQAWVATLARLAAVGTEAGRGAAEWWAQDILGGRATGNVRATARRLLAGIDDGDPAVLDTLPTFTPPMRCDGRNTAQVRYSEAAYDATRGHAPQWRDLTDEQRAETIAASREAFDTAVLERVTELCHLAASPTGADVSHLHPDQVRIGSVGVFAGDWAWTVDADGADRIGVGFVGTLVDTWNGWAVFSCTREVAEAIVADQQEQRRQLRESYRRQGVVESDLDGRVNAEATDLRFDGEVIVADQRAVYDDPEAIERISPDGEGRYVVMGWNWCWQAVDPYDCDRIVGDLPQPDQVQQWVRLPHTGLRVPHDRLKVTGLRMTATHNRAAYTATLALDGQPVGSIQNGGNGGDTDLASDPDRWGWQRMVDYAAACRHHGQPATEQQVLDALVIECEVDEAIQAAEAAGGALARLVDTDGTIRELRPVTPTPRDLEQVLAPGPALTCGPDQQWEIWTGASWFAVPGTVTRVGDVPPMGCAGRQEGRGLVTQAPDTTTTPSPAQREADDRADAYRAVIAASAAATTAALPHIQSLLPTGWHAICHQAIRGATYTVDIDPPTGVVDATAYLIPHTDGHDGTGAGWLVRVHNRQQRVDFPLYTDSGAHAAVFVSVEAAVAAAVTVLRVEAVPPGVGRPR